MRKNPQLKLTDLARGLERLGPKYDAIDVLADDVIEARSAVEIAGLHALDPEDRRFRFRMNEGKSYDIEILPDEGLIRMSRAPDEHVDQPAALGLTGNMADRAVRAAGRLRGEGAEQEHLILGLLVGPTLGRGSGPDAPRRVFTMQFDSSVGQWRGYSGGLVPWMKEHLLQRSA